MPHVQYNVVHLQIARGLIINVCEASVMLLTDAAAASCLVGRDVLEKQEHFAKILHCGFVGFDCWTVSYALCHGSCALKMEAASLSMITYQTTVCKSPEDRNIIFHCCGNLTSHRVW
jgi:hypothetical protein